MPVSRRAYVVAKFVGAAPAIAVGAVIPARAHRLPGPGFDGLDQDRHRVGAAAVLDALSRDPTSYAGMPSVGEYLVMLSMVALLAVFLLAVSWCGEAV